MKLTTLQRTFTIACTALLIAVMATPSQAQSLQSWSKKIDDVDKRFRVLSSFNNEAVLDTETQLVWQRAPFEIAEDQGSAAEQCLLTSTGGVKGWRLPAIYELNSLLVPTPETGDPRSSALPEGHPFLGVTDGESNEFFWSASLLTKIQHITANFWLQNFSSGRISASLPELTHKVWCVRGSGPVSGM